MAQFAGLSIVTPEIAPPPGMIWVVREVDVYSSAPVTPSNLFLEDAVTGGAWWHVNVSPTQAGSSQWQGRQVFGPRGFVVNPSTGSWDVRICGYQLKP